MTIEDQIRDEKVQYDINREATNISALSSASIIGFIPLLSSSMNILLTGKIY